MEDKRLELVLSGQVQGVGLRLLVYKLAIELGLKGWVRNYNDGTVHVIAEGNEKNLKEFVDWCYNGTKNGRVDDVKEKWGRCEEEFNDFDIIYSRGS